jgi:RNA-directed DNA polymerase
MYGAEKSDIGIVPKKAPNKMGRPIAEVLEGRGLTKRNLLQFDRFRKQRRRLDMENTKRAQKEKSRIRPSGDT